jgi:hypothetical protein
MQLQKVFTVQKISAAFHGNFILIAQEITNHLNGLVIKILHEKDNIRKGKLELISKHQIEKTQDELLPTVLISKGSFIQVSCLLKSLDIVNALHLELLGHRYCIVKRLIYF